MLATQLVTTSDSSLQAMKIYAEEFVKEETNILRLKLFWIFKMNLKFLKTDRIILHLILFPEIKSKNLKIKWLKTVIFLYFFI